MRKICFLILCILFLIPFITVNAENNLTTNETTTTSETTTTKENTTTNGDTSNESTCTGE